MAVQIFANGEMETTGWVRPYLEKATVVIAADGGARHLEALGRRPDILIGDLDSLPLSLRRTLQAEDIIILDYPEAKDETDLELALLYATTKFREEILVFGGLGGRLDQTLANVLLLMHPKVRGCDVRFLTEFQQIWLVEESTEIAGRAGDTVSLIPLGGDVRVRSTKGLRWALIDDVLSFGPARGLSNVMLDDVATVSVASGALLCIHTSQVWHR